MKTIEGFSARRELPRLSPESWSSRPRDFLEWKTLRAWGELPYWEIDPPGYLLRLVREDAGLTQAELGERLGVTQQAVAQAERWDANPTVALMRRWAVACGARLAIDFVRPDAASGSR
ncbi:MAG: helix-turn-helix domain-containing protein [Gemmatimonadetes bacterium]|nr:helix-turn-helix domain-containing protein [Gemmatimonadota bacterium]